MSEALDVLEAQKKPISAPMTTHLELVLTPPAVLNLVGIQAKKNYEMLRTMSGGNELIATAYLAALDENPKLQKVEVELSSPAEHGEQHGLYGALLEKSSRRNPGLVYVGWNKSAEKQVEDDSLLSQLTVAYVAQKLGIPVENVTFEIEQAYVLAHELGHQNDALRRQHPLKSLGQRLDMGHLPVPHMFPSEVERALKPGGSMDDWFSGGKPAILEAMGYESPEDLIRAQYKAYKDTKSERMADEFAVRVFRRMGIGGQPKN